MDRELNKAKIENANKDTIMTMDEAMHSGYRLEAMKVNRLDQSSTSMISKHKDINIRVSTDCSKRDASQHRLVDSKRNRLNNTGEEEFPVINNSVVEDSLPFQGLDNHTHHVSMEGFSGARMTYYNNKSFQSHNNAYHFESNKQLPNLREKQEESTIYFKEHSSSSVDGRQAYADLGQRTTPDRQSEIRRKLSSRNNSMFRIKKFSNIANVPQHQKSNSISSDNNIKHLRNVQKSMPRLNNSFGIFNAGSAIKDGVIDLNRTYDLIQQYSQQRQLNNGDRQSNKIFNKNNRTQIAALGNPDYMMPPNKNLSEDEKMKWKEIMNFLRQNPGVLLDLMPDDVDLNHRNNTAMSRKGQSVIPDLGIVPPQPDNMKITDNDSIISHNQKHSFGDSRFSADSYQRQNVFPIKHSFKPMKGAEELLLKPHNTPSNSGKFMITNYSKKGFKPNTATKTMNDYQTPSFLTSNIVNTVNKTVYKARVAALGSRGQQPSSNTNQKDTTIIEKKSIIIESETENNDNDSDVTQSQVVQMQNTINLASDTTSDAPTRKRSKNSDHETIEGDLMLESRPQTEIKDDRAEGAKTQKRSKSSKLQNYSQTKSNINSIVDQDITNKSQNISKGSKSKLTKSIIDESIRDHSADRSINDIINKSGELSIKDEHKPIKNKATIRDESDNDPSVSNIDRSNIGTPMENNEVSQRLVGIVSQTSGRITPDNVRDEKSRKSRGSSLERSNRAIIRPNPTEEQLRNIGHHDQIKSNDTTIHDMIHDSRHHPSNVSDHEVILNDGDKLTSVKEITPKGDVSSKTIAPSYSRNNDPQNTFEKYTDETRDVQPNFGDQRPDTVTIDHRSQGPKYRDARGISIDDKSVKLGDFSQKHITPSHQSSKHSSFGKEEHKTPTSKEDFALDATRKNYRETSYFGDAPPFTSKKSIPRNLSTIEHNPHGGIYEIESEGIQDFVRKNEPEPEFEDEIEPDGENEEGYLDDDTKTIYYNQSIKSFSKRQHTPSVKEKEILYTPEIKEERQSDESASDSKKTNKISQKSTQRVINQNIKQDSDSDDIHSLSQPIDEPDAANDDEEDGTIPKQLSGSQITQQDEKEESKSDTSPSKHKSQFPLENKSEKPATSHKSRIQASNKTIKSTNKNKDSSQVQDISKKPLQSNDFKSHKLPSLVRFDSKEVAIQNDDVEESKNESILGKSTTTHPQVKEKSGKSILSHKSTVQSKHSVKDKSRASHRSK